MSDPVVSRLHDWLKAHEQELLDDTRAMLQIPSLESEPVPNGPFGAENRKALDLALSLCQKYGLKTKDLDGYIGYAEIGSGPKMVMSLGHLDVVPVGPGWKHDPFGAEIDGEYIYARGAEDDKGPTMASFFAIRALHECCPDLGVRVRQVFGCNEESGFGCVHHYVKVDEAPVFGIAPDSGWPLIYGEKNMSIMEVSMPVMSGPFALIRLEGGQRPNIVIDKCEADVKVSSEARAHVEAKLKDAWDRNVEWKWDGDTLKVVAHGKAAHGATPFLGDSAATRALRFLTDIAPLEAEATMRDLLEITHPAGTGLGIHGWDEATKDLTCNIGIIKTAGGKITFTVNSRYPVTWEDGVLEKKCRDHIKGLSAKLTIDSSHGSRGLYFPLDHPLSKTIIDVYRDETGDMAEPETMGGGTYARAVPNTVSVGTGWLGDGKPHETDERMKVEHLFKMSRIYAHILYKLAILARG